MGLAHPLGPEGPQRTLRVLLFSPRAAFDPPSGDLSYTEALLRDPPPGVDYTPYDQAIEAGSVVVRGRRPRHGTTSARDVGLLALRTVEAGLRQRIGVMFREPTWFVTIDPSSFDLVHQHTFSVRQVGPRVPAFTTAGFPLGVLYASREGWPAWRTTLATRLERLYARCGGIDNPGECTVASTQMAVYSRAYADYLRAGGVDGDRISVIGTGLQDLGLEPSAASPRQLGFVGRDFERKGGDIALAAFRELRAQGNQVSLVLVTSADADIGDAASDPDVQVYRDPPRSVVLHEVLPKIGVLLAPTRADCGAPYGILEALQAGVPVITSDSKWLDDRLVGPGAMRVPARADSVAAAVVALWSSDHGAAGEASRSLWEGAFSMAVVRNQLRSAYDDTVRGS